MGLDMFLYGCSYEYHSRWDEEDDKKSTETLTEEVYWRKCNAVHKWFVDNCQEGNDDCRMSYSFGVEKLKELRDICNRIIKDKNLAEELLPVSPGFFFGSYEYDEYYMMDIQYTYDNLSRLISEDKYDWYYYCSSW